MAPREALCNESLHNGSQGSIMYVMYNFRDIGHIFCYIALAPSVDEKFPIYGPQGAQEPLSVYSVCFAAGEGRKEGWLAKLRQGRGLQLTIQYCQKGPLGRNSDGTSMGRVSVSATPIGLRCSEQFGRPFKSAGRFHYKCIQRRFMEVPIYI